MTESAHRDPLVGTLLDNRYEIQRRLARGGMAGVYLATDRKLRRQVAVKVLYPHLAEDPSFVTRFESEAISAARLSHPHVVSVFDQGIDGETAYLVLEYVPGATLRDVLREQGRFSPRAALEVTDGVLGGLSAAHDAGLVHRDVKPENVLLAPDGRIKVADFGLARAASTHTATGALIGTVAYVSPELVTGRPADTRSDLYAVGVMLYEMLTGEQPFNGDSAWQVALAHVNSEFPTPSSKVPGLSSELDELVRWCTEQDPEDRPHSAADLLSELRHIRQQLAPTQLDLNEDTAPLSTLLASTLALMGRAPAATAAAATAAVSDAQASASGSSAGADGAEAAHGAGAAVPGEQATVAFGHPTQDAASDPGREQATTVLDAAQTTPATERVFDVESEDDPRTVLNPVVSPAAAPLAPAAQDSPVDQAPTQVLGAGHEPTQVIGDPRGTPADAPYNATAVFPAGQPSPAAFQANATAPIADGHGYPAAGDAPLNIPRLPGESEQSEVPVPQRVGKREAKAEAKAWKKRAQKPTEELKRPGSVKRGWIWAVVVLLLAAIIGTGAWFFGAGPGAQVLVPQLSNAALADARVTMSQLGVEVSTQEVFDEKVASGRVVGTDPPGGTTIRKFEQVQLLVSKGPELFAVPNVVGQTTTKATQKLKANKLALGKVSEDWDESMGKGLVIKQGTAADKMVRSGTAVDLVVSKGPAPVAVPDLSGRSAADAQALIESAGLVSKQGEDVYSDTVQSGQVAIQDVEAGKKISRGSTVTWQLSKGPELVEVPRVIGSSRDDAVAKLKEAGLEVQIDTGNFGVLFDRVVTQDPKGGTMVRIGSTVTIGLY